MQLIRRFVPYTSGLVPLVVGFGVSKPEHARGIIEAGADGVIVGSAFVNIIQKNRGDINKMLRELEELASQLKAATRKTHTKT